MSAQPKDDRDGLLHPRKYWPHYPFLPMKRRKKDSTFGYELGVLYFNAKTGEYAFAERANILAILTAEMFQPVDIDQLLKDGWIAD